MNTKICKGKFGCGKEKHVDDFGPNPKTKSGKSSTCRECTKIHRRNEYLKNREKRLKNQKKYQEEHREERNKYARKYYVNNSDKIITDAKKYYIKNKEHVLKNIRKKRKENSKIIKKNDHERYIKERGKRLEYGKVYYKNNKEVRIAQRKKYYNENKKIIIKKSIEYEKNRIKKDPVYKIIRTIRSRTRLFIKSANIQKIDSITKAIGCSKQEFIAHIESKFYNRKSGEIMTWENYGYYGWHIDHIKPLSSFDLTNEEQFKKACHYTNLQPLWAEDNLTKSNSIVDDK